MGELRDPLTIEYLEHRRTRDPVNTWKARRRVLGLVGNAGTATREDIEAFFDARSNRAASSRLTDLGLLRSFYRWCDVWEHRTDDPTKRIEIGAVAQGLPQAVSREELNMILRHTAESPELRRAVALGAYGGLRIAEVTVADWRDVNRETRRLRVHGKGGKERMVGLSPLLMDEILPDVGGNIVRGGGRPYNIDVLTRKINRAIKAAGVDATFHKLRHRFGTVALAETGDIAAVARAMGHATPATTAKFYAASSDETLDVIAAAVAR
jgi:integrase